MSGRCLLENQVFIIITQQLMSGIREKVWVYLSWIVCVSILLQTARTCMAKWPEVSTGMQYLALRWKPLKEVFTNFVKPECELVLIYLY